MTWIRSDMNHVFPSLQEAEHDATRHTMQRVELPLLSVNLISCTTWGHWSQAVTTQTIYLIAAGRWQQDRVWTRKVKSAWCETLWRSKISAASILSSFFHLASFHNTTISSEPGTDTLEVQLVMSLPSFSHLAAPYSLPHSGQHSVQTLPKSSDSLPYRNRGWRESSSLFQRTGGRNVQDLKGLLNCLQ